MFSKFYPASHFDYVALQIIVVAPVVQRTKAADVSAPVVEFANTANAVVVVDSDTSTAVVD